MRDNGGIMQQKGVSAMQLCEQKKGTVRWFPLFVCVENTHLFLDILHIISYTLFSMCVMLFCKERALKIDIQGGKMVAMQLSHQDNVVKKVVLW
jgi:hypothetical protein